MGIFGHFFGQKRIFFGVVSVALLILLLIEQEQGKRLSSNLRAGFATSETGRDKELLKRQGRESAI